RRGREGHPRGARSVAGPEGADRRPPRRNERHRGTAHPRAGRAREHLDGSDDARGGRDGGRADEGAGGRGAQAMSILLDENTRVVANVYPYVRAKGVVLIGPNCPGLISPGKANIGIIPGEITGPGPIGLVSRSGTLTYQVMYEMFSRGVGQSTCIGIGGDPIVGSNFIDVLGRFADDDETKAVVLIGEIGGDEEE